MSGEIYVETVPVALAVLKELTKEPGYKDLSKEDQAYFDYHVKSKALHLQKLQSAILAGKDVLQRIEEQALLDLKSIEDSLDLIAALNVNEKIAEKSKMLAFQALKLAIDVIL